MNFRIRSLQLLLIMGILVSFFLGITLSRYILNEAFFTIDYWVDFGIYSFIWLIVLYLIGFFDLKDLHKKYYHLKNILFAGVISFFISYVYNYSHYQHIKNVKNNFIKSLTLYCIIGVFTLLLRLLLLKIRKKNVIIVGGSFSGRAIAREILMLKDLKLNLIGYVSDTNKGKLKVCEGNEIEENKDKILDKLKYLGKENDLLKFIEKNNINYIVIAKDRKMDEQLIQNIKIMKKMGIKIYFMDEFFEIISWKVPILHMSKEYFYYIFRIIENKEGEISFYSIINRLIMNISLSLIGIILTSPILLIAAIITKMTSKGPILFKQARVGKDGENFMLYKFRSMKLHNPDEHSKYSSENDPRISKWGAFMRKTRIDELPQFFNILKGDMNLIGPRAEWDELVANYEKEIPFYHQRHIVRPGLTGWAQVNYPYGQNINDTLHKLQYDLYYVKNRNFVLDLLIILKTIKIVITGRGM